jgi:hypothetical protein
MREQLGAPAPLPTESSHPVRDASNLRDDCPHVAGPPAPSAAAYPSEDGDPSVAACPSDVDASGAADADALAAAASTGGADVPTPVGAIGMSSGAAGGGSLATHAAIDAVSTRNFPRSIFMRALRAGRQNVSV